MLRSFLPAALVLLLAPSTALAGADAGEAVAPVVGGPASLSGAPETAERSASKRSSSKRSASKSTRRGGGRDSGGGDSGGSRDGGERRDGGDGGGDGGEPRASRRDGGEPPSPSSSGGRPAEGRGEGSAERSPSSGDRSPAEGPSTRPAGASSGGTEARDRTIRSRPDVGSLRPTEARSPLRSDAAPTVRKVSVGTPGSASLRPVEAGAAQRSAAPANFRGTSNLRGTSSALAATSRSRPDGGGASAERHGGGSDAVRATAGPHAARHHEAARHARATAAAHRAAAHHRAAAARHYAWVSAHRPYRWYHPAGWFRPWRPGYGYWYHGVFVYGPYPWYHHHHHHTTVVVEGDGGGHYDGDGGGGGGGDAEADLPQRKVDRARTFAVGLRGGSYMGGYDFSGGGFGDAGLGLAARYRPVEALGLEVSWMHHDQTWDDGSERVYQPLQASVQLFGAPWTKVNPYVLAGVTVASRSVEDDVGFTTVTQTSTLWGPHAGLGIEFGVGKQASINFDARYTGYLNTPPDDLTFPGAFQGNMGVNFYF